MDAVWQLSCNKVVIQQHMIGYIVNHYKGDKPIYISGAHKDDNTACLLVQHGVVTEIPELTCAAEEADDRIIFTMNYFVVERNKAVLVEA